MDKENIIKKIEKQGFVNQGGCFMPDSDIYEDLDAPVCENCGYRGIWTVLWSRGRFPDLRSIVYEQCNECGHERFSGTGLDEINFEAS